MSIPKPTLCAILTAVPSMGQKISAPLPSNGQLDRVEQVMLRAKN